MSSRGPISNAITFGQLQELPMVNGDEIVPVEFLGKTYHIKLSRILSAIDLDFLGLDRVDNTSDAEKPLSDATIAALATKADTNHEHTILNILGLQEALNAKADTVHGHQLGDVEGLEEELATLGRGISELLTEIAQVYRDLGTKADKEHTHGFDQIEGLTETLQSLQDQIYENANDNNHNHSIDQITGLELILSTKANVGHTHKSKDIEDFDPSVRVIVDDELSKLETAVISVEPKW